ncbi:cytochrome P450 2U1-like [Anneissia japonica]|uniref:cytochrome P450 2U1-like n=1 Tax=Anneissia japonica TaxID=1529436 RepID=UPI001425556C|nr:cytochrome P450 2U1-like [Anneissia japonica]
MEGTTYRPLLQFQTYFQNVSELRYFILALVAILCTIYIQRKRRQIKLPPGPPSLPLLGSIPWINRENPIKSFTQWQKQYGSIVSFYIGSKRHIVVNDAKLARELLIKHADVFSERPDIAGARLCFGVEGQVQDEIDNAVGERPLRTLDKLKVPYFEATICEVQRLGNIVPVLIPHRTSSDFVVNGYDIPGNTEFNVNLAFVHTDPKYWKDPFEFKPERFMDADEKTCKKGDAFMPFGLGRRACLGESLAKMEIYIFMASLLQRFTFELPESNPRPSFEPMTGVTQSPRYFEVVAMPR